MTSSYFKLINIYEFFLKFNITSAFVAPCIERTSFSFNDKQINSNFFNALPALFLFFGLFGFFPRLTFIKKPSATFKTRKGDLFGFAASLPSKQAVMLLDYLFIIAFPESTDLGYKINFGFGFSGNLQVGVQSFKALPLVKDTHLARFYSLKGFDLNFALTLPQKSLTRYDKLKQSVIFYSNLPYFNLPLHDLKS